MSAGPTSFIPLFDQIRGEIDPVRLQDSMNRFATKLQGTILDGALSTLQVPGSAVGQSAYTLQANNPLPAQRTPQGILVGLCALPIAAYLPAAGSGVNGQVNVTVVVLNSMTFGAQGLSIPTWWW